MKRKQKILITIIVSIVMSVALSGCIDRENEDNYPRRPELPREEPGDLEPPRDGGGPDDTDWVEPPRNPDGSIG